MRLLGNRNRRCAFSLTPNLDNEPNPGCRCRAALQNCALTLRFHMRIGGFKNWILRSDTQGFTCVLSNSGDYRVTGLRVSPIDGALQTAGMQDIADRLRAAQLQRRAVTK